jgi:transposase InsO family protein
MDVVVFGRVLSRTLGRVAGCDRDCPAGTHHRRSRSGFAGPGHEAVASHPEGLVPDSFPEPSKAEAIALFRLGIVGDLLARELSVGELQDELVARAERRYRPPGSPTTRRFHWKTLQAWYYLAKRRGHAALIPVSRKQGHARGLTDEQRDLLIQIRVEHPSAAADLILDTAVRQGVIAAGQISASTLRRLFVDVGAPRGSANRTERRQRRRWEAARPCALWHADVCHVWLKNPITHKPEKIYVHGLLDDHSRFVPALEARKSEQEVDLLSVLCGALLKHPAPQAFYVDNGSCYRGDVLALLCARLDIRLIHAKPYDPASRGKMERFWRTMRQRCTDHLPVGSELHDANAALLAYLDADYHVRPHASLMGETPLHRFHAGLRDLPRPQTARELATALELTVTRKIAGDGTFSLGGTLFEIRGRHLLHKQIQIVLDPFTEAPLRVSFDGRAVDFGRCDPSANRHRGRTPEADADDAATVPFDPIAALLDKARKEQP